MSVYGIHAVPDWRICRLWADFKMPPFTTLVHIIKKLINIQFIISIEIYNFFNYWIGVFSQADLMRDNGVRKTMFVWLIDSVGTNKTF